MDTKLKGDIAEQAAVLQALKFGVKIQVKSTWFKNSSQNVVVDNRRTKTNRRRMIRDHYSIADFDFALVYLAELDLFYVFPVAIFISYGSEIQMVEAVKRQRKPRSAAYRGAWQLIEQWVVGDEG